jgi:hypothetical protein
MQEPLLSAVAIEFARATKAAEIAEERAVRQERSDRFCVGREDARAALDAVITAFAEGYRSPAAIQWVILLRDPSFKLRWRPSTRRLFTPVPWRGSALPKRCAGCASGNVPALRATIGVRVAFRYYPGLRVPNRRPANCR